MTNEEIVQKLSNIEKKQDKVLNLLTKISKALHLLPVTEKEERAIQIAQRNALATAAKVNDELNVMENKSADGIFQLTMDSFADAFTGNVYEDIIDTDYLGG
jgi:hypothetical protein